MGMGIVKVAGGFWLGRGWETRAVGERRVDIGRVGGMVGRGREGDIRGHCIMVWGRRGTRGMGALGSRRVYPHVVALVVVDSRGRTETAAHDGETGEHAASGRAVLGVMMTGGRHGLEGHGMVELETVCGGHGSSAGRVVEETGEGSAASSGRERSGGGWTRGGTVSRGEDATASLMD